MGAYLKDKIERSRRVIRLGLKGAKADDIAIAWTGGKDSTVLLHLVKTMFGNVPFPVFFNDSTMEFQEIYGFIQKISKLWRIRLITVKHSEADLKLFRKLNSTDKLEFTRIMKINAINQALAIYKWKGIMSGIRRDEHKARSKETYISKRPNHIRMETG